MASWAYRCEGAEEAVLNLTEHGDQASMVQGGPDSKELGRWTLDLWRGAGLARPHAGGKRAALWLGSHPPSSLEASCLTTDSGDRVGGRPKG